ncbi:MAG: flagellar protein FlgN [Deltaproteobacteria bacterium]|nr:flagellar protein FlgN [Deltaproteobacteria bacterium]
MTKNPFATYLFKLSQESIDLARVLKGVLEKERGALITLNTDEVLVLVTQKESGMLKLARKRAELRKFARTQFGAETLDSLSFSDEQLQQQWNEQRTQWILVWTELRDVCEQNQKFINHSMKNLDRLVGNLKRLLGQHATYSPKGKRVDQNSQGAVVEGRY